jgi:tRNA(His) 5'-end guanylyltransferase
MIVRIDGVNFSRVCDELGMEKPYDERLLEALILAAKEVFERLNPKLVYLFSDEISFLFSHPLPYSGREEKINSIIPSIAAGAFSVRFQRPVGFDSRILAVEDVADYFAQRQDEAWRNHLNSYAFYFLVREGIGRREAAKRLEGMKSKELRKFMLERGVDLTKTPSWQRRGVMLYRRGYTKEGYNPLTKERTLAKRMELVVDKELPIFNTPEGRQFLSKLVEDG